MGLFFSFYRVHRGALAELADASLAEIAERAGWAVQAERAGDTEWLQLGRASLWTEDGAVPDPTWSFRMLAQRGLLSAFWALRELARARAWPTLVEIQGGHRHWWIAGLVHPLLPAQRERYDAALYELARMTHPWPVEVPWFDARVRQVVEAAPLTGPVLRARAYEDHSTFAEVDPEVLAPLLDWADTVRLFPDPLGREDATDWDAFVRQHLRVLRSAGPGEILLTELA